MSRAGISGMGVISALGDGLESTRKALFGSAEPIPRLPGRFETSLELPVFELPDPCPAGEAGLPVHFLLRALDEALAAAKLTPEMLRAMKLDTASSPDEALSKAFALCGKNAQGARSHVECDTLILDGISRSDTIPKNEIYNEDSYIEHEATVSKINEEQLFYLMSRGLTEKEATQMIVMGFIEPFAKELPMEYAVELNQLIKMDMSGSVG